MRTAVGPAQVEPITSKVAKLELSPQKDYNHR